MTDLLFCEQWQEARAEASNQLVPHPAGVPVAFFSQCVPNFSVQISNCLSHAVPLGRWQAVIKVT